MNEQEAPQITLTPPAVDKIRQLILEEGNSNLKLRMFVAGGGCSGFQYGFAFEEATNDDDHIVSQDGVTCVVDYMSMQYLAGAMVDYQEDIDGTKFVVKNPNAQSSCGCGSSFSV